MFATFISLYNAKFLTYSYDFLTLLTIWCSEKPAMDVGHMFHKIMLLNKVERYQSRGT